MKSRFDPEVLLVHSEFIRGVVRHLVTDPSQVDDVLQQTWITAIEHPPPSSQSVRGWLTTVAVNWARKWRRGEVRRKRREAVVSEVRETEHESESDMLARELLVRRVTDAVLALREPYRTAILLRYYDGLTTTEIAERLDVPYATIRTRLKRAAHTLRARLDDDYEGRRDAWLSPALCVLGGHRDVVTASSALVVETSASARSLATPAIGAVGVIAALLVIGLLTLWYLPSRAQKDTGRSESDAIAAVPAPPSDPSTETDIDATTDAAPSLTEDAPNAAASEPAGNVDGVVPHEGTLVAQFFLADGTRAAGILVGTRPAASNPAGRTIRPVSGVDFTHVADETGTVRFASLPAGEWEVIADRQDSGMIAFVRPGGVTEVELTIPGGRDARGIVVDADGNRVRGASLILRRSAMDPGVSIGRSGPRGVFHVRSLSAEGTIEAVARGHAPSARRSVGARARLDSPLTLELSGPGGNVSGCVTGPEGGPVVGSRVLLVPTSNDSAKLPDGISFVSRFARTDASGCFDMSGIRPGAATVVVRSEGGVTAIARVSVSSAEEVDASIELGRGATLSGRVSDDEGRPVAGFPVRVFAEGLDHPLLSVETLTDEDGSYLLDPIPSGWIVVECGPVTFGGATRTRLLVRDAERVSFDPPIDHDRLLSGRVLDERGEGLADWWVEVVRGEPMAGDLRVHRALRALTDAEGRFRLAACPSDLTVTLKAKQQPETTFYRLPGVVFRSLIPGAEETVLRVSDAYLADAYVTGTVRDVADRAPPEESCVWIELASHPFARVEVRVHPDGTFRAGPLVSGRYRVSVRFPVEFETFAWDTIDLPAARTMDLGTFREPERGGVRVFVRPEGALYESASFMILDQHFIAALPFVREGNMLRTYPLVPGPHFISVTGKGVAYALERVEISSGAVLDLDLELRPGVRCTLSFSESPLSSRQPSPHVLAVVRDEHERVVTRVFAARGGGERPFAVDVWLAPGRYAIEGESTTGLRSEGRLVVTDELSVRNFELR